MTIKFLLSRFRNTPVTTLYMTKFVVSEQYQKAENGSSRESVEASIAVI